MPDQTLEAFARTLPRRPFCTDEKGTGVFRLPVEQAAGKKYIQANPTPSIRWITIDVDAGKTNSAFGCPTAPDWEWGNAPRPNIIVRNPHNDRAHLLFQMETPVSRTDAAKQKPLKYLAAVYEGLRHELGGDPSYSGFILKNPLSSAWRVEVGTHQPYDLGYLAEFCDLNAAQQRLKAAPRREQAGLGRTAPCSMRVAIGLTNGFRTTAADIPSSGGKPSCGIASKK